MTNPIHAIEPRHRPSPLDGETLSQVKQRQNRSVHKGALGLEAASHATGLVVEVGVAAGSSTVLAGMAVASPVIALVHFGVNIATAQREAKEINQALKNDIAHQATLHLARKALPEGYRRAAVEQRLAGYRNDESARKLLSASTDRTVDAVVRKAGGLSAARKTFEDGVRDGTRFAAARSLGSEAEIQALRRSNAAFRQRFDADPSFHHGVRAAVWERQHVVAQPQQRLMTRKGGES